MVGRRHEARVPRVSIDRGEVVELEAPGPFVIRTQDRASPVYVTSYMTGGEMAPYHDRTKPPRGSSGQGDPDFVNVAPAGQYLPTFGNTNLVFVRDIKDGAKGVVLDCLGPVTGWQRVGASDFEMARWISSSWANRSATARTARRSRLWRGLFDRDHFRGVDTRDA